MNDYPIDGFLTEGYAVLKRREHGTIYCTVKNGCCPIGDGAIKLNQAISGFMNGEVIRNLTGVKGAVE